MASKSTTAASIWDGLLDEVALLAAWIGDWKREPKGSRRKAVETFEGLNFYQILDINPEDVMSEQLKVNLLFRLAGDVTYKVGRGLTEERPFNIIRIRTLRILKARLSALRRFKRRMRYVHNVPCHLALDSARLTSGCEDT